jgi:hypothetical protein
MLSHAAAFTDERRGDESHIAASYFSSRRCAGTGMAIAYGSEELAAAISTFVVAGLVPAIHVFPTAETKTWMPGRRPRLSGSILVDRVHDVDSSVF